MNEVGFAAAEALGLELKYWRKRALLADQALGLGGKIVTSILEGAPYAEDADQVKAFISACDEYRIASVLEADACHCVGRQLRKTGTL